MKEVFILVAHLLATIAKLIRPGGARAIVAESLLLKHQLLILNRGRSRAPRLSPWDRLLLAFSISAVARHRIRKLAVILKPETLLAFHKSLVRKKYRRLFLPVKHGRPGPKGPSAELIAAVLEMKQRNPRFGCPRIAQEITHTFGLDIDKDVVRRILEKHYRSNPGNNGPSWLSVIAQARDSLWSVDLFRCESIGLKSYWVMVVMDVFTRRIIGFGIEPANIDGVCVCRMFNRAIAGHPPPQHLSSDNDTLFRYHRWRANLRILEIEEIKSIPYTPTSHPFVERLIGTIRREYLDQTFFWGQRDLARKLDDFKQYYNEFRVHSSLAVRTPSEKAEQVAKSLVNLDNFDWKVHCKGLFQTPIAV